MVEAQLGRAPRGSWRVATRCHLGVPMVIESRPRLDDGSPFPTLYWLTCPVLSKRVGTLEGDGHMNDVNRYLVDDDDARGRLSRALARYVAARDAHEVIDAPAPGGGPDRIKCLHAHVAHELAGGSNPVGSWALAATGYPDCRQACFSVSGG